MIKSRFDTDKCFGRKRTHIGGTHFSGGKCTEISLSIVGEVDEADQVVDWA